MSRAKILAALLLMTLAHGIILSPTQAEVFHSTPRAKLRKRHPRPFPANITHSLPEPFIPRYDWEQEEYVTAHNDLRRTLGMPPLQWDPKLALFAHFWALERQSDCNYRSHSFSRNRFGENIFWMQYKEFTPRAVVQQWFSEQRLFDHTTNRCKCPFETDECECGHYLNVIWKTTQRVGCSSPIYCAGEKGLLVVCNYEPAGNIAGVDPLNPGPESGFSSGQPSHRRFRRG